ncbi:MAG: hypothetical protein AAFO69_21835, partial [Bacteroidota bacterium]
YSKNTRTVVLKSSALKENTRIRVFGRFRISGADGYLIQPIQVEVIPNAYLSVAAVEEKLKYGSQALFDADAPEAIAKVKIEQTQPSAQYQAFFSWVDPTVIPDPITTPGIDYTEADWGRSQEENGEASEQFDGTGETPLVIPLSKYLPEDVNIYLIATNKASGKSTPLFVSPSGSVTEGFLPERTLIRYKIYPDTAPSPQLVRDNIGSGEKAQIMVLGAQVGGYYQLYNTATDQPAGPPQFMSKRRTIGLATIEIDLSVAPDQEAEQQVLELLSDPLEETTTFYVKVTKPINGLSEILEPSITVNVV